MSMLVWVYCITGFLQVLYDVVTMKTDCDLEEQGFVIKYVVKAEGKTTKL